LDNQRATNGVLDQVEVNKSELANLSIRDLFYKYVRFLPIFLVSVAVALLIGFLIIRYKVPVYQVAGSMIIQSEKPAQNDKFEVLMAGGKAQNIAQEIEIMRSKPLMQRVISELNLQYSYYVIGKIKTLNVYRLSPFIVQTVSLKDSNAAFTLKLNFINSDVFTINKGTKTYGFNEPIDVGAGTPFLNPPVFARVTMSIDWSTSLQQPWRLIMQVRSVYCHALQVPVS
jgi:hypothetical protein